MFQFANLNRNMTLSSHSKTSLCGMNPRESNLRALICAAWGEGWEGLRGGTQQCFYLCSETVNNTDTCSLSINKIMQQNFSLQTKFFLD